MNGSVKQRFKGALCIAGLLFVAFTLVQSVGIYLSSKPALVAAGNNSKAYYSRSGELLRISLSDDEQYRLWRSLDSIPSELQTATLLYEDKRFYQHGGVNIGALIRASYSSYVGGGRRMGASTITMQLARMQLGLKTRTISGKLKQIKQALILERHFTKSEILEAYLNIAPYGHNIQGVGAASVVYFHKPVNQLTHAESMLLAVIPQNPNKRAPTSDTRYQHANEARSRLVSMWDKTYQLSDATRTALSLPLSIFTLKELPFQAPHFVDALITDNNHADRASSDEIHTSLSIPTQTAAEKRVRSYIDSRTRSGVNNAAALILDHRSMEIVAEVGSVDFANAEIHGQVNGTRALRSPGSTLKPFIYALGLQQGLIHPNTLLKDTPRRFSAYTPENYEKNFSGPLSATQALIRSRNIPAVTLLQQLKAPSFHDWLALTEPKRLESAEHYGLALALGGNEVSMLELVQWYSSLANRGRYKEATGILNGNAKESSQAILSAEASFLTLEMLSKNTPVDRQKKLTAMQSPSTSDPIPWKTGTSYAFRDAWAIGLVGHYVVAVWVGNFDGAANPALVGRKAAAPLFFELVRMLQRSQPDMQSSWSKPELLNVRKVSMCKQTGDLEIEHCPEKTVDWFIPGVSPIKSLNIYREILIDSVSGLRACSEFVQDTEIKVFEFWPSDIELLFADAGVHVNKAPPYHPQCAKHYPNDAQEKPEITSPTETLSYSLRQNRMNSERIPFSAIVPSDTTELYWFVGNEYVGRAKPTEPFLWHPKLGNFKVTVMDNLGRSTSVLLNTALVN